jgi:hypothetical protein
MYPGLTRAVERVASAIANARGNRRGVPQIVNILDLLPMKLLSEVTEEAEAALEALGYRELLEALEKSVKLQSHYARLLNMNDGGKRMTFDSAASWMERLKSLEQAGRMAGAAGETKGVEL